MKTSKILKNRHTSRTLQAQKTLAYIGKDLKMQKKISYRHSEQYITQKRKMLTDFYCKQDEERRKKRWAEMDRLEELNKKNVFQKFKENAKDVSYLIFGLLTTPLIMIYDDIKKEFSGNK